MAIYVADPWDGLSPGFSGAPPGWSVFGECTTFASDGAFPGHNYGNGWFSPLASPTFNDNKPSPAAPQIQCQFGCQFNAGFQFQVCLSDISGNALPVLSFTTESDNSISMRSGGFLTDALWGGGLPTNSGIGAKLFIYQNVWYYLNINLTVQAGVGAFLGSLYCNAGLAIDGEDIFSATGGNIPLSNFPTTGSPAALNSFFNQTKWFGNPYSAFNTQVLISDPGEPLPDPTIPNARISQAVIEPGIQPVTANVRIPQMVIEPGQLFVPNVRISQMVIEVPTFLVAAGGFFPEYIKRRTAPGNN